MTRCCSAHGSTLSIGAISRVICLTSWSISAGYKTQCIMKLATHSLCRQWCIISCFQKRGQQPLLGRRDRYSSETVPHCPKVWSFLFRVMSHFLCEPRSDPCMQVCGEAVAEFESSYKRVSQSAWNTINVCELI